MARRDLISDRIRQPRKINGWKNDHKSELWQWYIYDARGIIVLNPDSSLSGSGAVFSRVADLRRNKADPYSTPKKNRILIIFKKTDPDSTNYKNTDPNSGLKKSGSGSDRTDHYLFSPLLYLALMVSLFLLFLKSECVFLSHYCVVLQIVLLRFPHPKIKGVFILQYVSIFIFNFIPSVDLK